MESFLFSEINEDFKAYKVNMHQHMPVEPALKGALPGYCEIEIVNDSMNDVRISGIFDDGTRLSPFNVYSFEAPHYISLHYYGYCHSGMTLFVRTFDGQLHYSGYVRQGFTLHITSWKDKLVKVALNAK